MPQYYSPSGNLEVWDKKPSGYFTEEDWLAAHPSEDTPEEIEARAKTRSAELLALRMQKSMVQTMAFTPSEFGLFAEARLFEDWKAGETYAAGYRLAHGGIVYEVVQEVTALENQPPDAEGMLAIYRPLSVDPETGDEPDGSRERPYAFLYGMDVTKDRYYSYDGKIYLAKADMPACVWTPDTAGLWQWEEVT